MQLSYLHFLLNASSYVINKYLIYNIFRVVAFGMPSWEVTVLNCDKLVQCSISQDQGTECRDFIINALTYMSVEQLL